MERLPKEKDELWLCYLRRRMSYGKLPKEKDELWKG